MLTSNKILVNRYSSGNKEIKLSNVFSGSACFVSNWLISTLVFHNNNNFFFKSTCATFRCFHWMLAQVSRKVKVKKLKRDLEKLPLFVCFFFCWELSFYFSFWLLVKIYIFRFLLHPIITSLIRLKMNWSRDHPFPLCQAWQYIYAKSFSWHFCDIINHL